MAEARLLRVGASGDTAMAVAAVCTRLASHDAVAVAAAVPEATCAALRAEAGRAAARGLLRPAAIGRGARAVRDAAVRGDAIAWLDALDDAPACAALGAGLFEPLRLALNAAVWLNLAAFEAQLARYVPGTGYEPHLDRFADSDLRAVSLVLYLNDAWTHADGGALRFHWDGGLHDDVPPDGGTLVAFLSDRVRHEVLPATRERWSVAAWYLRRA